MKRLIDYYLKAWVNDPDRKPLLLRGARQVGKTYAAHQLGTTFPEFVAVNLEFDVEIRSIFEQTLDPKRIVESLTFITKKTITPGKTLLFLDEIQAVPQALLALRYFYEMMPELHVIAAGSLLDFAIEEVGIPVGRVQSLYMYPMSFIEFLAAHGYEHIIKELLIHDINEPLIDAVHNKILSLLAEYCAIGGMPRAVFVWQQSRDLERVSNVHQEILGAYRQDFNKYAKKQQVKYVEKIFDHIPLQLGEKFKYSIIEGEYRKRELAPALDLLETGGIAHKILYSAGQGVPLGAQSDPLDYKVIFLDVGLSQAVLNLDLVGWIIHSTDQFINKGSLIESFVGQEMLAYSNPIKKSNLYYWQRKERTSQAEVDYLMQEETHVVPIEVKSGAGSTLKSLHMFLATHTASPFGVRFSTQHYSVFEKIKSYPLYAIIYVMALKNKKMQQAVETLTE